MIPAIVSVSLVDKTSFLEKDDVAKLAAALTRQAHEDFGPIWGIAADVVAATEPSPLSWNLFLVDDVTSKSALGNHADTPTTLPAGYVFCKTTIADGSLISTSASHELLEMLADPYANRAVAVNVGGQIRIYALEVADPCEDDQFAYKGADGILVSDFVTPEYFDPRARGMKLDFCGHIQAPLQVLQGGFLPVILASGGWRQIVAGKSLHKAATMRYAGNRFHRRAGLKGTADDEATIAIEESPRIAPSQAKSKQPSRAQASRQGNPHRSRRKPRA